AASSSWRSARSPRGSDVRPSSPGSPMPADPSSAWRATTPRARASCMGCASVSLVTPTYTEGQRAGLFLCALREHGLSHPEPRVDFLVVDDGSAAVMRRHHQDALHDVSARGGTHTFRLVEQPLNQGKGASIRRGWRESGMEASWWGFVDADGAVPAAEVFRLVGMLALTQ